MILFKIFFPLNSYQISVSAKAYIANLIYNDSLNNNDQFWIIGFADYLGTEKYNQSLSLQRAHSIVKYLNGYNFKKEQFKIIIGAGEVSSNDTFSKSGNEKDRYVLIVKQQISSKHPIEKKSIQLEQQITQMKVNETLRLDKIYFFGGQHFVKPESMNTLNELYLLMQNHKKLKISIEGHICCTTAFADGYDSDTHDNNLSTNRAKFIFDFLVAKGIDKMRMKYVGFARKFPIIELEKTEEDANQNRRVEIRI